MDRTILHCDCNAFYASVECVLNPELKKEIPENTFFHMTDLADKLLAENRRVGMYPISEDSFLDMGEFEEMHRMEEKLNLKSE